MICKEEDHGKNFQAPLSFTLYAFHSLCLSLFSIVISSKNGFEQKQFQHLNFSQKSNNNDHVKMSDVPNRMFSFLFLFFKNNFIDKYVRSSIISKVLTKGVLKNRLKKKFNLSVRDGNLFLFRN